MTLFGAAGESEVIDFDDDDDDDVEAETDDIKVENDVVIKDNKMVAISQKKKQKNQHGRKHLRNAISNGFGQFVQMCGFALMLWWGGYLLLHLLKFTESDDDDDNDGGGGGEAWNYTAPSIQEKRLPSSKSSSFLFRNFLVAMFCLLISLSGTGIAMQVCPI